MFRVLDIILGNFIKFNFMEKKFLTAKETAEYIGTTLNYLYKLTSHHQIPYYSPTGRRCLFKREEIDAWIEKSRVPTNEDV